MFIYTGAGWLFMVFFVAPIIVIGGLLYYGFGIDVLKTDSWWPLHSMMILGAIMTFAVGTLMNRKMIKEITYEKSGPVESFRPRHTFYFVRLEYWGPIILALYFVFVAYRSFR